jgi:hypothetical protein
MLGADPNLRLANDKAQDVMVAAKFAGLKAS